MSNPRYPDLSRRVVVVTGGTKGIGLETVKMLLENDARVVVNGRDRGATDAVVAELSEMGGSVVGHAADVSRPDGVTSLHEATSRTFGKPDALVAFAGGFNGPSPLLEISLEEWETVIRENLTATYLAVRQFLPDLIESGRGSIVTMASAAGRYLDAPAAASYAAAKAGVVNFTRHVALEYGPQGVRANCVAPGTVLSPRVERLADADLLASLASKSPLGRNGLPRDVGGCTLFLLSEASSWLTGTTLDVSGGRVML